MRSVAGVLRLPGQALALSRWGQACGGLAAHSRQLSSDSSNDEDLAAHGVYISSGFDAAEEGAPVAVHQLIGDPRTGVADDTTTSPWGADVSMEWVWSSPKTGVDWFRYSMAGPDQLPHMYMDSRLSDHSKNLMYVLRCKDPQRWTIPALAEKFCVRRQRVMAILALKEIQAHRLEQGLDMKGPLQPYTFKVPLQDFHVQPDGQPVDLAQLVAQQQQLQEAAAASSSSQASGDASASAAADGLGSLDDFLAPDIGSSEPAAAAAAAASQPDALSSLSAAAGGQAADLAVLMPQLALTAQQLQLELLQLLQQHHYSIDELQRRLLQQIDVAEAYYNAHVAGTPLEQQLLAGQHKVKKAAAKKGDEAAESAADAAVVRPAWLDFGKQRQEVQQLLGVLAPLLQTAGPEQDREAGRLLVALKHALQEAAAAATAAPAAATGEAGAEGQQQPEAAGSDAAAGLCALVKSLDAAAFAAVFNQLDLSRRQQLLELVPEARITLNVQGTDLRAALSTSSSSSSEQANDAANPPVAAAAAPGLWPGQVPPVVDVWGYEEVPKQQLAALQKQVAPLQQLLDQLQAAAASLGSSSSSSKSAAGVAAADMQALQQATQVYTGLVWEYDRVLSEQAAAASGRGEGPPLLPPTSQRRLMRILRELDVNALEKLLLWESYLREEAWEGRDSPRVRRLLRRVHAALKALDEQAAAQGQATPYADYPDLPDEVPGYQRVDKDMACAHLDAEVVGRQFHRGSGDRHYVRMDSYPSFEGYSLQEFDSIEEGELSTLSRLAAEREDNMMWKEFRERLLHNIGLTAPDLYQHLHAARPPKPRKGWSYVVHPMGCSARALTKQQLRQQKVQQWLDDDAVIGSSGFGRPGDLGAALDPARDDAPAEPYVAVPGSKKPKIRGLNEEEETVVGYSRAKPRRRWYASLRGRVL